MNIFSWQYRYFQSKIRGVEKMILDLEFKRFKTLEIREEVRQVYDNTQSRLSVLLEQIKKETETPTLEKGDFARLEDQKVLMERDIERYKKQMDGLDLEVNGSKPTNEYPEGIQGINSQLESLHELKLMLRDYLKL